MKNTNSRLRIGIIGAGASGLVSAWLLEDHHDITIFEKENRLGGHVYTVPITTKGKTIPVEAGVEFFSDMMFAQFKTLLKILKVSTRSYPLTYTFYHVNGSRKISLPLIHDGTISWKSLKPQTLFDLMQLKHFVNSGKNILETKGYSTTLANFADTILLTPEFKEHFLYPFFAASWGVTPDDMKMFSAYDIIAWAYLNKPAHMNAAHWNEVIGGMSSYIEALACQLKYTTIKLSTEIATIARHNHTYIITQSNGTEHLFDHVILATNAKMASRLMQKIDHAQNLKKALEKIHYFPTTIAIHGDKRFMPADNNDWAVANIRYDGFHSALTTCKPDMRFLNVFRSWITYPIESNPENAMPHPLYALHHFDHPWVNHHYFLAQQEVLATQGKHNLWIAGFYTHDTDSHNSAIVSAINITRQLAPQSDRLHELTS